MNFAIANPARQVFFTVVGREEKYKAKNLIDVVVYRGSDALYGWVFDSLQALGLEARRHRAVALPVAAGWLVLSAALGRTQERRAAPSEAGAGARRADDERSTHDAPRICRARRRGAAARRRPSAQTGAPLITRADPEQRRAPARGGPWHRLRLRSTTTRRPGARRRGRAGAGRRRRPADRHRVDLWRCRERAGRGHRGRGLARQALHRHQARSAGRRRTQALADATEDGEARPAATPQRAAIRSNRWRSSRTGRRKACAATSASPRPTTAISPRSRRCCEREKPDFVQIDYSLDDREAEKRILPLAAEVRAGVLTALPFGRGRLFRAVRGKEIPDWARAFAGSWAQFFLKYLLGDPRVTAVIPGTADPATWRTISAPCAAACPMRRSASGWSPSSTVCRQGTGAGALQAPRKVQQRNTFLRVFPRLFSTAGEVRW